MNTSVDQVKSAVYKDGYILVTMESQVEIRFPIAGNARLSSGTPRQLNNIEISPFGLHWPDLDEDLSFRGLLEGDYGQGRRCRTGKGSRQMDANGDPQGQKATGDSHSANK